MQYGGVELFHKASVFGKNEVLYEVELALGTTRVFDSKFWYSMGSAI